MRFRTEVGTLVGLEVVGEAVGLGVGRVGAEVEKKS